MPTIRQLPPSLVNKIAAGEVIERPASVVKELLENSIDAGATDIELTIHGGGIEMIRISDDGCGIAEDQISLAIASHATSKLESADDLFDVDVGIARVADQGRPERYRPEGSLICSLIFRCASATKLPMSRPRMLQLMVMRR